MKYNKHMIWNNYSIVSNNANEIIKHVEYNSYINGKIFLTTDMPRRSNKLKIICRYAEIA